MVKTFICQICRYIAFNEAPVECPVCGAAIENFENNPDAVSQPVDTENLSESEKKHIPVIAVDKTCGTLEEGACTYAHIEVGSVPHVMETEHYIQFIDVYLDKKYISRTIFTPRRMYPVIHIKINADAGVIAAISHCNTHGSWRSTFRLE